MFAVALVAAATVLYVWWDYRETVLGGNERAQVFANLLAEHARQRMERAETVLVAVSAMAAGAAAPAAVVRGAVDAQQGRQMMVRALVVADADGSPIASAGGAERELTAWLREHSARPVGGPAFVIGAPIPAPGGKVIPVLRAEAVAGGPVRLAAAALQTDFLGGLHHGIGGWPDTSVLLVLDNGAILSRAPFLEDMVSRDLSMSALWRSIAGGESGVFESATPIDGVTRVFGFRRVAQYGMRAVVGLDYGRLLAPWRLRAARNSLLAVVLTGVVLLLGRMARARGRSARLAQDRLRQSEQKYRTALTTLAEGVVTQDARGVVVSWNDAALSILHLTADQLAGRAPLDPCRRAMHDDGSPFPRSLQPAQRALATGVSQLKVPMGIETGAGGRAWLEVSAVPIMRDERVDGVVVSFVDVSERRAAIERMRELNENLERAVAARTEALTRTGEELENVIYTIAHDLRAPSRQITAFAALLLEGGGERFAAEECDLLARIRGAGERQARLIDDLLKYAASGQERLERTEIDMHALIREVIADLVQRAPDAARVDWVLGALRVQSGDRAMVGEILSILLSNAVKFSSRVASPRVEIESRLVKAVAQWSIQDNGAGFDGRYANKLFGMFQRLHQGEGYEGVGIGLAVCRRLVIKHGGSIEAEGAIGVGAIFRFTLDSSS